MRIGEDCNRVFWKNLPTTHVPIQIYTVIFFVHFIRNNEALVHMIKATIGGGFLNMPEAYHNVGIVIGVLGSFTIGLAVLNMMTTIVRCSQTLRSKYGYTGQDKKEAVDVGRGDVGNQAEKHPLDFPETVSGVFLYGARGRFSWLAPFAKWVKCYQTQTNSAKSINRLLE